MLLNRDADMYDTGVAFYVRTGTTICGGRGRAGITGGVIRLGDNFHEAESYIFMRLYAGCRLIGLHIDAVDTANGWHMTAVRGSNVEIANCELHGFGQSHCRTYNDGTTSVLNMWVHHNYIHHTLQSDGMAVAVVGGSSSSGIHSSALVEGNYFNNNSQTVGTARGLGSYISRYNYIGPDAAGKTFDAHGQNDNDGSYLDKVGNEYEWPAGENIEIYNNTCLASGHGFIRFRGTPHSAGFHSVHNNWTYETKTTLYSGSGGYWTPICQQLWYMPEYGYNTPRDAAAEPWGHHPWVRMEEYDNWFGSTPPPSSNHAPVLDAVGNKAVFELGTLAFTISATDPDGDTLTYSASNLPVGATFNPATRTFTWTPQDGQSGVYANIRFLASDGSLSDTEDITITVSDGVQGDVNSDGVVNSLDMIRVGQHWNETGESGWIREDISRDGTVNVLDATLVGQHWTG
jgi:hypothetical protein